jgi:hypothetical protein
MIHFLAGVIGETRVGHSGGMESQEVPVAGRDDSARRQGIGHLLLVGRTDQSSLGRRRHVDAVPAQARGDGRIAMLIEVERDRPGHRPSFA